MLLAFQVIICSIKYWCSYEAPWPSVCFFICIFMKESVYLLLHILNSISAERRNVHKYPCHLTTTYIRPIQLYVNYNRERTDRYFVRAFVVYISLYVCIRVRQSVHLFSGFITETAVFISIKVLCRCQNA